MGPRTCTGFGACLPPNGFGTLGWGTTSISETYAVRFSSGFGGFASFPGPAPALQSSSMGPTPKLLTAARRRFGGSFLPKPSSKGRMTRTSSHSATYGSYTFSEVVPGSSGGPLLAREIPGGQNTRDLAMRCPELGALVASALIAGSMFLFTSLVKAGSGTHPASRACSTRGGRATQVNR